MNDDRTTPRLPLNDSQRRALSVVLASLEQNLHRVEQAARQPPPNHRLTRFIEPPASAPDELLQTIRARIRQLADDLQLPAQEASISRSLIASLLLDEIGLEEVEPVRLRGYGAVDAGTAAYLNRELLQLRALLVRLTGALNANPP